MAANRSGWRSSIFLVGVAAQRDVSDRQASLDDHLPPSGNENVRVSITYPDSLSFAPTSRLRYQATTVSYGSGLSALYTLAIALPVPITDAFERFG